MAFGAFPLAKVLYVFGFDAAHVCDRGGRRLVRLAILSLALVALLSYLFVVAPGAPLWVNVMWLGFAAPTVGLVHAHWRIWYILAFVPVDKWRYGHAIYLMRHYVDLGYAVTFQRGKGDQHGVGSERIPPLIMTASHDHAMQARLALPTTLVRRFRVSSNAPEWQLADQMRQFFERVLAHETNIIRSQFDVDRSMLVVTISGGGSGYAVRVHNARPQ